MKKVIIIAIAVVLLAVLVLSIFVIPARHLPAPITIWEQKQLAIARGEGTFDKSRWMDMDDPETYRWRRYYGKYSEYFVVWQSNNTAAARNVTIGDYVFYLNASNLTVWKDGIRFDLVYAYEHDKISDEDLAKIYAYYTQIESALDKYMDESGYR